MNYYRIIDDIFFDGRWELHTPESESFKDEPFDFTSGHYFPSDTILKCQKDIGEALDFTLAHTAVPIASEKLVKIIKKYSGEDVQFIPVSIEGITDQYFIINALKLIDCLDHKRSAFVTWKEENDEFDTFGDLIRLRLDRSKIDNSQIFRIKGGYKSLIVSEDIKNEIEKHDFKGIVFESVT